MKDHCNRKQFYGAVAAIALMLTAGGGNAKADIIYQLTTDHCTGGCNPNPPNSMGMVVLHQNGTGDVLVTVDLFAPLKFVNTGLQNTIDFNLGSIVTGVTADNFTNANFSLESGAAGSDHFDGFGDFQYSILLNTPQGVSGSQASPLSFDVHAAGLTESSFTTNAVGWVFGVDVYNPTLNNTGPIGGNTGTSTVPEPTTISLFGSLAGLVAVVIRSRKRAPITG